MGKTYDYSIQSVRLRVLKDLFRGCILPAGVLYLALRLAGVRLGFLSGAFVFPAAALSGAYLLSAYKDYMDVREARRLGAIPVPRVKGKLPGNIDILFRLLASQKKGYMLDVFSELYEETKSTTINIRILGADKYATMDSEHIKFVYNGGFSSFWRGHTQKEIIECFLGSGILNRDDEEWRTHRMIARPFFATERVSDLDLFEKNAQKVINVMLNADPNDSIDLEDLVARFTVDTASEFLFGQNLNTLSYGNDGFGSFTNAFMDIQTLIRKRSLMGNWWPLLELFKDKCEVHKKKIRGWVDPLVVRAVQIRKEMREKGQSVNPDDCTFLEYLATTTQDTEVIRDQLLNILLAARDTTTALLTHIVYFFAVHPDVLKKVREEILEVFGPDGTPTVETMRRLKYLQTVINETLRLFSPLPASLRDTRDKGVVLPPSDPTYNSPPMYVPPRTPLATTAYLMQRSKALWGPDAEEFKPERWLDPELQKKVAMNPALFIPFASGPRNCIGQNYALNESTLFLVRLLQRFDEFTIDDRKQLSPPWKKDPTIDTGLNNPNSGTSRKWIERIWPGFTIVIHIKGGRVSLWSTRRCSGWIKYLVPSCEHTLTTLSPLIPSFSRSTWGQGAERNFGGEEIDIDAG